MGEAWDARKRRASPCGKVCSRCGRVELAVKQRPAAAAVEIASAINGHGGVVPTALGVSNEIGAGDALQEVRRLSDASKPTCG
jgi:hypothetical protein